MFSIDKELLTKPICASEDLGKPLPASVHAVSVAFPTWADVVGYEEYDERIMSKLKAVYPRFCLHPIVDEFFKKCNKKFAGDGEVCFAFPSKKTAEECSSYIKKHAGVQSEIINYGSHNVFVIKFPDSAFAVVKAFWQHAGQIVTSRLAESILKGENTPDDCSQAKSEIKERIARLSGQNAEDVYLSISGMGSIYTAHQLLVSLNPGKKTIQIGFPYVDILKIQEKFGTGVHFIPESGQGALAKIEKILEEEQIAGVFCEFPSNPLLKTIEIDKLSQLLRKYNVPLVVDDTIVTWHNVDLSKYADISVTSLTKFFSGVGDVLGGSLVLNSHSPLYESFKNSIDSVYEDLIYAEDAKRLANNSTDFSERMVDINKNAEKLCNYLQSNPKIAEVYYPKFVDREIYDKFKKSSGGYGGLLSIILKNEDEAPNFYDALKICKGPSLGTNFTIACPYTILAHYHELDFAKSCGVSPNLIRVSVGLEDADDLIKRFDDALKNG